MEQLLVSILNLSAIYCTLIWSITIGGGIDYGSGPYTVTFVAGQTHNVFNVPLNNDGYYEGNENFVVTINSSSLPSRVTPGNPSQATVTIVDNDGKDFYNYYNQKYFDFSHNTHDLILSDSVVGKA